MVIITFLETKLTHGMWECKLIWNILSFLLWNYNRYKKEMYYVLFIY